MKLEKDQKIKIFILLIISNIFVYLISSPSADELCHDKNLPRIPPHFVQIKIRANLMTSFHYGKEITIYQPEKNFILDGYLISAPEERDSALVDSTEFAKIEVAISKEDLGKILVNDIYSIYPKLDGKQVELEGENYEVTY